MIWLLLIEIIWLICCTLWIWIAWIMSRTWMWMPFWLRRCTLRSLRLWCSWNCLPLCALWILSHSLGYVWSCRTRRVRCVLWSSWSRLLRRALWIILRGFLHHARAAVRAKLCICVIAAILTFFHTSFLPLKSNNLYRVSQLYTFYVFRSNYGEILRFKVRGALIQSLSTNLN